MVLILLEKFSTGLESHCVGEGVEYIDKSPTLWLLLKPHDVQEVFPIWRSISFDPTTMSVQTEQTVHDRINLSRLVKRLENSATNEDWSLQDNQHSAWIKTQGTLQA